MLFRPEIYYQDDSESGFFGTIRLVDPDTETLDVENDILGKLNYTSPNQVSFTNGLHIKFDNTATPAKYANNNYIVEGVGTGIKLLNIGNFSVPEQYAVDNGLVTPDYITINRASSDGNSWSRSNRWFHIAVVEAASKYRNDPGLLDLTGVAKARRPIIEFEPDLYLFNYGTKAKSPVDIIDFTVTDAFREIEGKQSYIVRMPNGRLRPLTPGTRIIFAADLDPEVSNKIYRVEEITTGTGTKLHLVSQNTNDLPNYTVSGARILANLAYDFVPTVTFENPIPGIGSRVATGNVILNATGVDSITVNYSGINYIANPYIKINSEFENEVQAELVYRPFKQVDYIRIDNRGTAYTATNPEITLANPNQYYAKVASTPTVSGVAFTLEDASQDFWDEIDVGMLVVGNGIVGGTTIEAIDNEGFIVTLSGPAISADETADPPLVGINTVAVGDVWTVKPAVTAGTYATVSTTVSESSIVTVDDTSMVDINMVVTGGSTPIDIDDIRIDVVPTRIITTDEHKLNNGDLIYLRDIVGTTELNFSRYYVKKDRKSTRLNSSHT